MRWFTLATWDVLPGHEAEFEKAWQELGDAFAALPDAPGQGTLLRRHDDPQCYVSFGPWPDLGSIEAMRAAPGAKQAIDAVMAHCKAADPGAYEEVATAESTTAR